MNRSRWVRGVLVVAVLCVGCGRSNGGNAGDPGTAAVSPAKLDAVLTDTGLKLSATHIRAGQYRISFRDLRTPRPAGERVALVFGPSGPRITQVSVVAGGESIGTLVQNDIVWVTVNGVPDFSPGGDALSVDPTPQYPTPVT